METPETRPFIAAAWMLGATASFSLMAVGGRAVAAAGLDTFELMLYRSLIGIVIVLSAAAVSGRLAQISARNLKLHGMRNIAHFTGQNLWFYAITVAPLAQVIALEFTTPLWVAVLAPALLGERLTLVRGLAALLGFIGIVIVAQPGQIALSAGVVTALCAAVAFALTAIATKRLTRVTNTINILFWLTLMQACFGLIAAGFDGDIALVNAERLLPVLTVAVCGLSAHFCITQAMHVAPASVVMPLDFIRLPLIALIGLIVYGEALSPVVFGGAGLIIVANLINLRGERRRQKVA